MIGIEGFFDVTSRRVSTHAEDQGWLTDSSPLSANTHQQRWVNEGNHSFVIGIGKSDAHMHGKVSFMWQVVA